MTPVTVKSAAVVASGSGLSVLSSVHLFEVNEAYIHESPPSAVITTTAPFGDAAARTARAFSFTPANNMDVVRFRLPIRRTGTPADSLVATIRSDAAGPRPGTSLGVSANASLASWNSGNNSFVFEWATPVSVSGGTKYWIDVKRTGAFDAANYYQARTGNAYSGGSSLFDGSTWSVEATAATPMLINSTTYRGHYLVCQDTGVSPKLHVFKSTDNGASWSEMNSAAAPSVVNGAYGFSADQSGPLIATVRFTAANTLRLRYFNTLTDSWEASDRFGVDVTTDAEVSKNIRVLLDFDLVSTMWSSAADDADLAERWYTTNGGSLTLGTASTRISATSVDASAWGHTVTPTTPSSANRPASTGWCDDRANQDFSVFTHLGPGGMSRGDLDATITASEANVGSGHFQPARFSGVDRAMGLYIESDGTLYDRISPLDTTGTNIPAASTASRQISSSTAYAGRHFCSCFYDGYWHVFASTATEIHHWSDPSDGVNAWNQTPEVWKSSLSSAAVGQAIPIPGVGVLVSYVDNGNTVVDLWTPVSGPTEVSDTDSVLLLLSETDTVVASVVDSDNTILSLSESDEVTAYIFDTDTISLAISESDSIAVQVQDDDSLVLGLSDVETVNTAISDTDTLLLATSESDSVTAQLVNTDTISLTVSESDSVVRTVAVSDTDTLAVSLAESDEVTVQLVDEDELALLLAESESLSASLSDSDSLIVATSEADTVQASTSDSDNLVVGLGDESTLTVSAQDVDELLLSLVESDSLSVQALDTDELVFDLVENDLVDAALFESDELVLSLSADGEVLPPDITQVFDSDTLSLTLTESEETTVAATDTDSIVLTVAESGIVSAAIEELDELVLSTAESDTVQANAIESDTLLVGLTEQSQLSAELSDSDSLAVSLAETDSAQALLVDSDSLVVSWSETDAVQATIIEFDELVLALSEEEDITVLPPETTYIYDSDTLVLTIADTDSLSAQALDSDSLVVELFEQDTANIAAVDVDELSLELVEQSGVLVSAVDSDTLPLVLFELELVLASIEDFDSFAISVDETGSSVDVIPPPVANRYIPSGQVAKVATAGRISTGLILAAGRVPTGLVPAAGRVSTELVSAGSNEELIAAGKGEL